MNIKPIGERVLIKIEKPKEEKTKSGIYLPKSDEEKKQGIVEEVGTDKNGKQLPLSKGDKVLYSGYSHEEIEIGNEKYVIVEFKDIIAKLTD
ncbi:MAG: co-chaperone GroES [Candidatus Pacearchaeota archaeon]